MRSAVSCSARLTVPKHQPNHRRVNHMIGSNPTAVANMEGCTCPARADDERERTYRAIRDVGSRELPLPEESEQEHPNRH